MFDWYEALCLLCGLYLANIHPITLLLNIFNNSSIAINIDICVSMKIYI